MEKIDAYDNHATYKLTVRKVFAEAAEQSISCIQYAAYCMQHAAQLTEKK